jgi:hypothetical protein
LELALMLDAPAARETKDATSGECSLWTPFASMEVMDSQAHSQRKLLVMLAKMSLKTL